MGHTVKAVGITLLLLISSACATRTVYEKEGAVRDALRRDSALCADGIAAVYYPMDGFSGASGIRRFYDRCMAEHGWAAREERTVCVPGWCRM